MSAEQIRLNPEVDYTEYVQLRHFQLERVIADSMFLLSFTFPLQTGFDFAGVLGRGYLDARGGKSVPCGNVRWIVGRPNQSSQNMYFYECRALL